MCRPLCLRLLLPPLGGPPLTACHPLHPVPPAPPRRIPATIAECKSEAAVLRSKWAQLRELPSTEVRRGAGWEEQRCLWKTACSCRALQGCRGSAAVRWLAARRHQSQQAGRPWQRRCRPRLCACAAPPAATSRFSRSHPPPPCCLPLQVATYLGFTAELYAWFCLGEIVGRGGSLTGYHV